ncbi:hypothetical protein M422DRAFT_272673 [Sphaerobolus stellatus SS14]|uniref:DUF6533 domain-containing protein n=1 Tax=Sphaerobolus stellatus (strain SS14) TaxID=990650 RepID=A0A0C9TWR0_SPHS4|nr:hypothetical protein M422DRAFT_272673 [Sphaerobolus stellatus SS14]
MSAIGPRTIEPYLSKIWASYSMLAPVALLVYDHALTFGDELQHLWSRRPHIIGLVTLFVRYFTLFTRTFDAFVYFSSPTWSTHPGTGYSGLSRLQLSNIPQITIPWGYMHAYFDSGACNYDAQSRRLVSRTDINNFFVGNSGHKRNYPDGDLAIYWIR